MAKKNEFKKEELIDTILEAVGVIGAGGGAATMYVQPNWYSIGAAIIGVIAFGFKYYLRKYK